MKAVIEVGGKQYLVQKDDIVLVDISKTDKKTLDFIPLLVIDGDKVEVGTPFCDKSKVTAEVIDQDIKSDKVIAIRYKAKKRVHKLHGHRQQLAKLKISKIA
jgi:large subunit ribosomal protein L21